MYGNEMSFFYTQIHNQFSGLAKGILPLMSILHVPNTGITFPWVYSGKTSQQVVKKMPFVCVSNLLNELLARHLNQGYWSNPEKQWAVAKWCLHFVEQEYH